MSYDDIYEPYHRLIPLVIMGKEAMVPENNLLLRCFQFLAPDHVPYGNFCWNADCRNCEVGILRGGIEERVLACQTKLLPRDEVVSLGPEIETVLHEWRRS